MQVGEEGHRDLLKKKAMIIESYASPDEKNAGLIFFIRRCIALYNHCLFFQKVTMTFFLMLPAYGAPGTPPQVGDVDAIRMNPEVTTAFGSLLDGQSHFYTWPARVVFLEEALADYAQRYFRVKGVQIYSGLDFGLMISGIIRKTILAYRVDDLTAALLPIHGDVQKDSTAVPNESQDTFFSFDAVDVGLDRETQSVLKIDLSFGLGYQFNRYLRPSVRELQEKYDIHILPEHIGADLERKETLTLAFQLPFKLEGAPDTFNLGTNLESKWVLATRTKTTFQRQPSGNLGIYNEVNLRSTVTPPNMPPYKVMAQFNFVTHMDTSKDPLNFSGQHFVARFCLKDAAVHLPRKAINLMVTQWFGSALSYLSDVNAAVEGLKDVGSSSPLSLDMFFPLAERAANEYLKGLPNVSLMTDKQLEQIPTAYQCAPYLTQRQMKVFSKLVQAKLVQAQLAGQKSKTTAFLEYYGAGLLTTYEVGSQLAGEAAGAVGSQVNTGRHYLLQTGKSLPRGVKDWIPAWTKNSVKWILGE